MKKQKQKQDKIKVSDLQFDDHNLNKGTDEGNALLEHSITKLGTGRSILVDKNGKIIAGNKTAEAAMKAGITNATVVESDGKSVIVVKRTDIDLNTKKGRELAIADNTTSEINYSLNEETASEVCDTYEIDAGEWGLPEDGDEEDHKSKTVDLKAFEKTHVLFSFPPDRLIEIQDLLEAISNVEGVEMEQSSN